jgi:hypothetical protein
MRAWYTALFAAEFQKDTKSGSLQKQVTTVVVYHFKHFVPKIFISVHDLRWMCHQVRSIEVCHKTLTSENLVPCLEVLSHAV